ncbi:hypothetical protein [uncultured Bacteroides sp.]|uniref:hypothetical protein n=1 Tax=uncultured Bacteroides sp. TaxID=162156 RepID=UPI002AA61060|nr:hypothetical protein [uncultured Bacteroides sp.]
MQIIKTNLVLSCTCKKCGSTYMAVAIYGGIEIDAESTHTIAEAHLKGDKVKLDEGIVTLRMCNCENDKR